MAHTEIYTKSWCPYSTRAKALLNKKGVPYTEIDVTTDRERELEMIKRRTRRSRGTGDHRSA
jgi:glutaredoxin 3